MEFKEIREGFNGIWANWAPEAVTFLGSDANLGITQAESDNGVIEDGVEVAAEFLERVRLGDLRKIQTKDVERVREFRFSWHRYLGSLHSNFVRSSNPSVSKVVNKRFLSRYVIVAVQHVEKERFSKTSRCQQDCRLLHTFEARNV